MQNPRPIDYSQSGLTIQQAMVDHCKRNAIVNGKSVGILWGKHRIQTSDAIEVPRRGVITATFLAISGLQKQGFDLKLDGYIDLSKGEQVNLLRTWADKDYEDTVKYTYYSNNGIMRFWNVYEMKYSGGIIVEEKWTENAGFWKEPLGEAKFIYHCNSGGEAPPQFNSMIVSVAITATD